jgi:hypothetical protein
VQDSNRKGGPVVYPRIGNPKRVLIAERELADAKPAPVSDDDVQRIRDRLNRVTRLEAKSA